MPLLVFSQTPKELKSDAQKLFDNQQFVEATPLYSRLLAIEPKNHDYNFKYGTCLLFQSNDKRKALDYLIYAVKSSEIPVEAYFYLGKAYHINYLFKEAIKYYTKFISLAPNSSLKQVAELSTNMCQNGKSKLTRFTDFEVIDKQELGANDFYRSYDLSQVGGELIVVSDFQTKIDKKRNHFPLVYFGEGASQIYYASYGNDGSTGLDIYKRVKSKSGPWSEPIKLPVSINSNQDENFPFFNVHTNELYFSSNSYESIGGFDIFKAKQINETQFSKPTTIDFAISSSEDDFLYISDSLDQIAYFASNRNCEFGRINVYKIKNERYLQNDRLVKGDFVSSLENGISITVIQQKTGKKIGNFSSNENKGYYFLFPEPGSYTFECKLAAQSSVIPLTVEIPTSNNRLPLAQQIVHERIGGEDRLSLINSDTITASNSPELLAELIRQKATLERSTSLMSGDKVSTENQPELTAKFLKKEADLYKKIAFKAAALAEVNTQVTKTENAFDYSIFLKNKRLVELNQNLKALIVAYNNEKVQDKKLAILQDANQLVNEVKKVEEQKEALLTLKQISLTPVKQQLSAVDHFQIAPIIDKLSTAVAAEKPANLSPIEIVALENFQARKLQSPSENFAAIQDSLVEKQQDIKASLLSNANEISALQNTIVQLDQQIELASDKKKSALEEQKNSALSTLKTYLDEQSIVTKKTTLLQEKINEIQTRNNALSAVLATDIPAVSSVKELFASSQQQVASNNSTTLQDFIAITVQKNPLPLVSTTMKQQFENEEKTHQQAIEKIQQSKVNEAVKNEMLSKENKQFISRLDQLETHLEAQTLQQLTAKEQEVLGQLAQHIQQAKDSASNSTTVLPEISYRSEQEISSTTKEAQLTIAQIAQQLKDLQSKSIDKLASIEANNSLEAAEKLQLIEQENQSMQLKEDSVLVQLEHQKNIHPTLDFSNERTELAQLKKDRENNVQSAIKRIDKDVNTSIQNPNIIGEADSNSNNLSSNVTLLDSVSLSSSENNKTTKVAIDEFKYSLNQLQASFEQRIARIQAITPEEKTILVQKYTVEWRSQLETKRASIASADYASTKKVQFNQLLDSAIATIDQQLVERSDEHKAYLSSLTEDQLQQNQEMYLREIGVLSPINAIIIGKTTLPKEAQLLELKQAASLLQSANKQEVVLQQKNPVDIQVISNQFYNEQLLNLIEETQQNLENELKLSVFEVKEQQEQIVQQKQAKEQQNTQKKSELISENRDLLPSMSTLEEESNFVFKLRSSFKSKEILTYNAQQEKPLLQLKLMEWKRYQSFLSNQLKEVSRSTNKTAVEMEGKWIESEITHVQQNIAELTQLVGAKTPFNDLKQALPVNSVVRFANETERLAGNVSYIPIDVVLPKGLLYRVQIGAFTNPMLAGDHPTIEPISGERMRNGWYRYLSGYFGEYESALKAQAYVRLNGFSDAYLVAYCDGEKISLQQAKELISKGSCSPYNGIIYSETQGTKKALKNNKEETFNATLLLGTNLQVNEASAKEQSKKRYFEAPDAVDVTPIEDLKGLMYTVQIGAFLVPVSEKITKGLTPLYTYLLPNKNIRYSVGIFKSIAEANQTKKEVISKGFKDAFIVAYYNGERITNQAAQELVNTANFQQFSHVNELIEVEPIVEKLPEVKVQLDTIVQYPELQSIKEKEETIESEKSFQFATKKSYSIFPRDVLNRYNKVGYFYYDASDGKVKSSVYSSKEEMPKVFNFKNDIDTLEINSTQTTSTTVIMLKFASDHLPGAFVDWLQRLSMRVQFTTSEEGVHVSIIGILPTQIEQIEAQLKQLELEFTSDKK